jgi:hypothetical protein
LRRDYAGIHPDRIQTAKQAGILNFHTPIHYHFETGLLRLVRGFIVNNAQLHPDNFGSDFDGLVDEKRNALDALEQVDDIDGFRDIAQICITLLPQYFVVFRIYRNYLETVIQQVLGGKLLGRDQSSDRPTMAMHL